jgi:uncharacterized membrane protein YdjX (TVP38/TMEM64 family)
MAKQKIKIRKRFWQGVSILLLVYVLYLTFRETEQITKFLLSAGSLTPLLTIIFLGLLGPTPIATDPIVMLMGVTYGAFWGMIIGAIGNTLAMFIEYYFGYKLAVYFDYDKGKDKLPKFIRKFPIDSWIFLIFGRMIPGYGSKIISLIAGAEKVNLKTYLWTSVLSGIFGAALLSYSGVEILKLLTYYF